MKKSLASLFLIFTILLSTTFLYSQNDETERVLFVKEVSMKYKKSSEYNFLVGYVANQDRQISLDFSGGPSKLKFSKSVFVKKGHSIVKIKLKNAIKDSMQELISLDVNEVIKLLQKWFEEAVTAQALEPNAMTLATIGKDGSPSARIVLLKGFDENGFSFFMSCRIA